VRIEAASAGSAAFLAPPTLTRPDSVRPPSILILSNPFFPS